MFRYWASFTAFLCQIMRRKEREIKNPKLLETILQSATICRLGIHNGNYPYVVPMNYGYDGKYIYFHCARQGKKLDLLRKDNRVGFEIEAEHELVKGPKSCDWTTKYRSVFGQARVEIVDDATAKRKGLDAIMQQHGKMENAYSDAMVNHIYILKLHIEAISGKQAGDWEDEKC